MSADLPVLLVHGFLSEAWALAPVRRRLEKAGYTVRTASLSPLCIQDVRLLSGQLAASVDRVRAELGVAQVQLVGLSQGGLIAVHYALHGGRERVERIITVGAPLRGTWFAAAALPAVGWISRGVWQITPISPFLRQLDGVESLPIATVAIAGDPVCPVACCQVPGRRNEVVKAWGGPFKHQLVVLSRRVTAQVVALLDAPISEF